MTILLQQRLNLFFCKNCIFDIIIGDFQAGITGQISSNLLKKALQHDSMPFFPLAWRSTTFVLGHLLKSRK